MYPYGGSRARGAGEVVTGDALSVSKGVGVFWVDTRGLGAIHVIRERHAQSHAVGGRRGRYAWSHTLCERCHEGSQRGECTRYVKILFVDMNYMEP